MPLARRRAPLVFVAMLSMVCGVWLGLVRLGWNLPLPWQDQLIAHGPLMICGFLGTLISLERAVALDSRWAYAAPILVAAGAVMLGLGPIGAGGPLLITAGSVVMVAIFLAVSKRQASLFLTTMTIGAVAWTCGNVQWLAGAAIYRVVFWWLTFLVLTIAGERLELNRVLRPTRAVRGAFVVAMLLLTAGGIAARWWPETGVRVLGVGLVAIAGWLMRFDVARRTVRQGGLTRFMAVSLLGGYLWLGAGGVIAAISGAAMPGVVYDAMLHAVFVGFVLSMVFAHAPIIFPAVLGVPLVYRPSSYLHVAVLHVSLTARVIGDLVDVLGRWRSWGGLLNAAALILFVVDTVRSINRPGARPIPRTAAVPRP